MKDKEQLNLIKALFSSAYCNHYDGRYQFSSSLKNYLNLRPELASKVEKIFTLRDGFMKPHNYDVRWEMDYFLMNNFSIEFEQSEGSELIFSLCLAAKSMLSLSNDEIGTYLKKCINDIG